jgi:hypothetical protein
MEIIVETHSYNQRRFSKPWIALVDFSKSPKALFLFGDWSGEHRKGGEGVLTLIADLGDIIATGQKDHRNERNSAPVFFIVCEKGDLDLIGDRGDAYKYYLSTRSQEKSIESLESELRLLKARIAEIDEILNHN